MIYLDNHATTRCDPRVVQAMLPWMSEEYGNASSVGHGYGERARLAVEEARRAIALAIDASSPEEVVFTSGATESNNLAIRGVAERSRRRGDHLVSLPTEHAAVLEPLERLAAGDERRLTLVGVAPHHRPDAGRVDPRAIADAVREDTCLVSVMLANNEIGVVQPLAEIAAACRDSGVLLHTDATQAVGKLGVSVDRLGVDLMSFTAHKLHGPKGVGALFVRGRRETGRAGVRPAVKLSAQITGGGQQRGVRSGTLNVPGIVGFAEAVRLSTLERVEEARRLRGLRDRLWERLRSATPELLLCGPALEAGGSSGEPLRLAHNLMVRCPGVDGEAVVLKSPGLAISSGAACSSADPRPSHVLRALGLSEDEARGGLRFGLSRFTTEVEIDQAADQVSRALAELRGL